MPLSLKIGPYQLVERLNVGGTAEVFLARHLPTKKRVTLKRLLPSAAKDKQFAGMFFNEQRILKDMHVPGVPRLLEAGLVDGEQIIALEHVDGHDMRTLLSHAQTRGKTLPLGLALYVTRMAAQILARLHGDDDVASHTAQIIHRDISPDNILLDVDGKVWLIDFGLAVRKTALAELSIADAQSGKWPYMSPEQMTGRALEKTSDIFSLGACAWEMLTGSPPFPAEQQTPRDSQIESLPPPSAITQAIPACLDRIIMQALHLSPSERYTSASEFARKLDSCTRATSLLFTKDQASSHLLDNFVSTSTNTVVIREESHAMAENKGGSDLDVFEGLARKPKARSLSNPPNSAMPPLPGSRSGGPPPPPARARTLLGMAPPLSQTGRSSLKAPTPGRLPLPSTPGLPPPPKKSSSTSLPALSAPPSRAGKASTPAPKSALPPTSMPPMPSKTSAGDTKKAAVEMDWDDEDEKTHVYDKQSKEDVAKDILHPLPAAGTPAPAPSTSAAAALLARSGSVAPPRPKQPSAPAVPVPSTPAAAPPKPPVSAEPTMISERRAKEQSSNKSTMMIGGALALIAIIGLGFYFMRPTKGTLKIYVSGPHDSEISNVKIFVDNEKKCDKSPCTIKDLSAGLHDVKAEAKGYEAAAPKGAEVLAGKQNKVDIELRVASEGTGLKATSAQKGIKLFIDNKLVGPLPQTLRKLAPGEHKVKFAGSEQYAPLEKTITVVPDRMQDFSDVKLKVVKGQATLKLATKGARILLVSSTGDEKQVDERMFKKGVFTIEIDTSKSWHIKATKKGFEDLNIPITFEDGAASKTFSIELKPKGEEKPEPEKSSPQTPKKASSQPTKPSKPSHETNKPAATGPARLNINSIPPAAVLIDGRPVGRTPKVGVVVSPGRHTITFIHPEKGRKSTSVTVRAGQTKPVGLRL